MEVIWKFELPLEEGDSHTIAVPKGYEVICLKSQRGKPVLYVKIKHPPSSEMATIKIKVVGTGILVDNIKMEYLDTLIFPDYNLVLHYFIDQKKDW